jgi:glycosyltransferase involved in cell wall biosynthesis
MTLGGTPIIWVDWARNLRTRTLTDRLGAERVEITVQRLGVKRYIKSAQRTIAAVRRYRPHVVIATNPSVVLAFLLLMLRRWFGYVLVSDAHYVGVRLMRPNGMLQKLLDFYNAKADLVVVTNQVHADYIAGLGGRSYICPDPLPALPAPESSLSLPAKAVLLVCSFYDDEPYKEVFAAFARLKDKGYELFVSGNYRKAAIEPEQFPWVRFLGFLPYEVYCDYLRSCALIMDLTVLDDCLVCGSYEALAAGKPLVLSRTRALLDYFGTAALLTDNTAPSIAECVERAYAEREQLAARADAWANANELYMGERIRGLKAALVAASDVPMNRRQRIRSAFSRTGF